VNGSESGLIGRAFDSLDPAIFIIDSRGVIPAGNRGFRAGLKKIFHVEYFDGISLSVIFPPSENALEYEYWNASLKQALSCEHHSIDHAIAVEGIMEYYIISSTRIEDGADPVLAVMIQNISKLKRVEDDANDAYDFIRKIVDLSVTGILTFSESGECVSANAAASKILGIAAAELLSVNFKTSRLFGENGILPLALDALASRNEHRISVEFVSVPGVKKWAEFRIVPFTQKGDIHLLVLVSDETERRQIEDDTRHFMRELKRSNEELEQYSSLVSHGINEPLQSIRQTLSNILSAGGGIPAESVRESLASAAESTERIQSIINGILLYSRVMTDGGAFSECDLGPLVKDAVSGLSDSITAAGGAVEFGDLPVIHADAAQISLLFAKLIESALSCRGTEIKIGYRDNGSEWLFYVVDNGTGIVPENRDSIFALSGSGEKNGMSLALCRRIVERHGGRIWVDSIAGSGSVFYFTVKK
jgi:PAS domain S-box-containing protein